MARAKKVSNSKVLSAREIQLILGPQVTKKAVAHELMRFTTMETKQLLTRLKRIKNPVKAEAMRKCAKALGERKLVIAAKRRRDELYVV